MNLNKENLQEMFTHALRESPDECCGLIAGSENDSKIYVYPCKNIQNKLHQKNPEEYPRDSSTAYYIDPLDYLNISKKAQKKGLNIWGVYHSHINQKTEAYFSGEDRRNALFLGVDAPLYKTYIVISVMEGKVTDIRSYQWNTEKKDFEENIIKL